jgi:hypothetical protein
MSLYEVTMIPVGESEIPGPELFWMAHWGEWLPLTFQVALVRGPGLVALVNTGPPRDLEPLNRGWESFLGPRSALHRHEGEFVVDQLAKFGVDPSDVTHVLLTPLQLYTVANVLVFDRAEICLSKRGWVHFHTTHGHPHDVRETSIPREILVHLVTDLWDRVRLLDDEETIAEGFRTWWSGGHHRASMVVEVETTGGIVALSDTFFWLKNVIDDHPIGICENIYEALAAHARVRRSADVIVPLYDPSNFERFPGGTIG